MEVRYKHQHNKITSIDTEIANHILENTSTDKGENLRGNRSFKGMKTTSEKISVVKKNGLLKTG